MSRTDGIAVLLCLVAVIAAGFVAQDVFENMAHLEDEFAYVWQAQVIARGDLTIPSPEHPQSFLVPFVIDYQGQRFGKYPLGWPAVLSLGVSLGVRSWVNPLLAGLAIWLIYRLGQAVFNRSVGLLAAGLSLTSPFFLINAGSLLSHLWSLVLSTIFILSWLEGISEKGKTEHPWLAAAVSGLSLGLLGLTRPLTMVAVGIPFGIQGLVILFRGDSPVRRRIWLVGGLAFSLGLLHFIWQYAVTGDFTQNPYTLWWSYDKLGFGPGYGVTREGHNLQQAWWNTKHSLRVGASDLFGWGKISWLFVPWGIWAVRKKPETYLLLGVPITLILGYGFYWVGSWLIGPRYYFEALPALALLSAAGISWLAGWPLGKERPFSPPCGWQRLRSGLTAAAVGIFVGANLLCYLPLRMESLQGLYTIERSDLEPFQGEKVRELTPALIIVHSDPWMSYGSLLEFTDPYQQSAFLFAWSLSPRKDAELAKTFQSARDVYHYYPDVEPWVLYTAPLPEG
ncbi:MAG: glycosyltransferase family 39 protein [Anaerolineales bacterium]|nr:glycosyltransferase family 39 protein [Anaerolineales bacterium]